METTIPGLEPDDLAALRLRLDCFDDFIVAVSYRDGEPGPLAALDPLDVAAALAGLNIGTPLLPRNCLFWQAGHQERLAIYIEPAVWVVRIPERLAVPLPGLVWLGRGVEYQLYAVKDKWPGPETVLFNPPTPNVSSGGICRGNVRFPVASAATIWAAWGLFIESEFNNHLSNQKSRKYPYGVLDAWRELDGAPSYPLGDLVHAGRTLEDLRDG